MSKKISVVVSLVLSLCMLCGILSACGNKVEPLESIHLNETSKTLFVGETLTLKATPSRELTEEETYEWKSDSETVATVSNRGVVSAKAVGTAKITVSVGEVKSNECVVTVKDRTITVTPADDFTLDLIDASNNTKQLTASSSEAGDVISWSSSDDTIASVDANGLVTATGAGTADIIAAVGATRKTVKVTVTAPADYYKMERSNNAGVYGSKEKWHWFTQGASVYTLASDPCHYDGTAILSFSSMEFGEGVGEYYFRYQPDFAEGTNYNFSCTINTNIAGKISVGIDDKEGTVFQNVDFDLNVGDNTITVENIPVVANKPLNIRIYIEGATAEKPLTIKLSDYEFTASAPAA